MVHIKNGSLEDHRIRAGFVLMWMMFSVTVITEKALGRIELRKRIVAVSGSGAVFSYNSAVLSSMTYSILRIHRDVTFKNIDQRALQ